jgi:hypothetical protein
MKFFDCNVDNIFFVEYLFVQALEQAPTKWLKIKKSIFKLFITVS